MGLTDEFHKDQLIFGLPTTLLIASLFFVFSGTFVHAVGIKGVPIYASAAVSLVLSFGFSTVWNSVHTRMHGKQVDVPFIPKVNVPDTMYDVYLKNHELHHQIKGDEKGNFNVVFLGADELFQTNNA
jgi:sterol desaturase/sphingolipid hydroxylase (fatty acid hydroxylase superfamily)